MQGEIYTEESFRHRRPAHPKLRKAGQREARIFVFNGHVGALTEHYPLKAKVGETVRIFFGVGGPNFTSSFHVIGEIFDRVYLLGSLTTSPMRDVHIPHRWADQRAHLVGAVEDLADDVEGRSVVRSADAKEDTHRLADFGLKRIVLRQGARHGR